MLKIINYFKTAAQVQQLDNLALYRALRGGQLERDIDLETDELTKIDLVYNEVGIRRRVRCSKTSDLGKSTYLA